MNQIKEFRETYKNFSYHECSGIFITNELQLDKIKNEYAYLFNIKFDECNDDCIISCIGIKNTNYRFWLEWISNCNEHIVFKDACDLDADIELLDSSRGFDVEYFKRNKFYSKFFKALSETIDSSNKIKWENRKTVPNFYDIINNVISYRKQFTIYNSKNETRCCIDG